MQVPSETLQLETPRRHDSLVLETMFNLPHASIPGVTHIICEGGPGFAAGPLTWPSGW
jgi:hypothetical protein